MLGYPIQTKPFMYAATFKLYLLFKLVKHFTDILPVLMYTRFSEEKKKNRKYALFLTLQGREYGHVPMYFFFMAQYKS